MAGTFELFQVPDGGFCFRLKASSGENLAVGATYATKDAAKRGVANVLRAAAGARIVDRTEEPAEGLPARR